MWSERLTWNLGIGTATILAGIALSVVGSVVSADPPQRPQAGLIAHGGPGRQVTFSRPPPVAQPAGQHRLQNWGRSLRSGKRTFRPSMARRLITVCSPIIIFGLFALFPLLGGVLLTGRRSAVRLEGPARVVVAGLAFAIGLGLAIRNALVGITYSGDLITVVNGFRTWRIPTGQVGQFRWTKEGLVVEWRDTAGRPQRTPVDAFHRGKNPMADLTKGQRAHRELEALRAGR